MNKLSPCPFCGGELFSGTNIRKKPVMRHPYNSNCPLSEASWIDTPGFRERWNRRSDGWISVEDRLPDQAQRVYVYVRYHNAKYATIGYRQEKKWLIEGPLEDAAVTHWMPLTQVPKEGCI